MDRKFEKSTLICFIVLFVFDIIMVAPAFSGFPPRSYVGTGTGKATFYVSPQDTLQTSTKPINLKAGTWFSIQIRIANFTHVYTWQYQLIFLTSLLSTTTANTTEVSGSDYVFSGLSRTVLSVSVDPFNGTHTRVLASVSLQGAQAGVSGTDKGVTNVWFQVLADPDPPSGVLSTKLYFAEGFAPSHDTWTLDETASDENNCTMLDGYYENRYVPPPPAHLEISPTVKTMPAIAGDRIVGTPRAIFDVDILIKDVSPASELFFVQLNLTFDPTLLEAIWVYEGTFMNNASWAPYGTFDNMTIIDPGGIVFYWVMINPNASSGVWDNTAWPSGDGLLATARFEVISQGPDPDGMAPPSIVASSFVNLQGVFGEFFIGHPNLPNQPYLPFATPINGTVNILGFYWQDPVADFFWTPALPLLNSVVTFDASASYGFRNDLGTLVADPTFVNYTWRWGDLTPDNATTTPVITHTYSATGNYNVTLTVIDNYGKNSSLTKAITITQKFLLTITITPIGGGTTNPAGVQQYDPLTNASVTAIPGAGYFFDHWELDGVDVGSANPITILMDRNHLLQAVFSQVLPSPPTLEVQADVGSLHFPSETAEFNALVTFQGTPVNATAINFKLYFGGALIAQLTGVRIATGLYRIPYQIPTTATLGTYTLVVQAEYYSARASTLKSFVMDQILNTRLTEIKDGIATIETDVGSIKVNLADINATVQSIDGETVSINTKLGPLKTTLDAVNAKVIATDGKVATVQTDLGTVKTSLGDLQATASTILYVTSALSGIAAAVAVIIFVLLMRRKK